MNRLVVVALVGAALIACDEDPAKTAAPTAPTVAAPQQVNAAEALANVPVRVRGSSVCSAYLRDRIRLQLRIAKAPTDTTLQQKATSLTAMLADACN